MTMVKAMIVAVTTVIDMTVAMSALRTMMVAMIIFCGDSNDSAGGDTCGESYDVVVIAVVIVMMCR